MRKVLLALSCLAALAACGAEETMDVDRPWPSEAERTMQEGHAPTPFTAEQIREACPVGRRSTYRIELPGRPPFLQVFHFVESDAVGAEVETSMADPDGLSVQGPTRSRSSWKDMQAHASYPVEATVVTEARVEVPAGAYACLLYRVEAEGEKGEPVVTEAWFAYDLPGPPVRMVTRQGGEVAMTMTLVAHEP